MYTCKPVSFRLISLVSLIVLLIACDSTEQTTPTAQPTNPPSTSTSPPPTPDLPLYQDATQPTAVRVEDLLARMTLAEKIGQMTLVEKNSIDANDIETEFIGALLSGGGGSPSSNTPEGWADMVNSFQEEALSTRLSIPLLYGVDAVHGHSNVKGTVIFPHNIALGATHNTELMAQIGRVTAIETAATGIFWNYAPVLAVPQDIRWGRTYEAYSEDTELVTELSLAYLRGLQGDDLAAGNTVLATPKHFVGDGGAVWGSSTTNNYSIDQGVTAVDEATLRAIHLAPYTAAIEAGAMSIMVSYSSWQDTKMHAQSYLMTDVLKGELGFNGFLVSDWEAIDQIEPGNYYNSVTTAINAGIDMNMVPYNYQRFIQVMDEAVSNEDITLERIDDAVRRILTVKFELGLFERPLADPALLEQVGTDEHRNLAREAVRQSLVLLQNDDQTLPLSKDTPLTLVMGQGADDIGIQSGGWTIEWQGKVGAITEGTTILEGIQNVVSDGAEVRTHLAEGETADVGIVVIGERPYAEGQGDSNNLHLSHSDLVNIERIRQQANKVVVIILSGRPLIITEELPLADAWIAAWLPGSEGQGVADVLFGDYDFRGKLPFTWPRSMEQLPFDFTNLPTNGCDAPLFPFGYGLTFADVESVQTCP